MEVEIPSTISVSELAQKMNMKGGALVKELMKLGVMANVNQVLDQETSVLVVEELEHKVKFVDEQALETALSDSIQREGDEESRAPVCDNYGSC